MVRKEVTAAARRHALHLGTPAGAATASSELLRLRLVPKDRMTYSAMAAWRGARGDMATELELVGRMTRPIPAHRAATGRGPAPWQRGPRRAARGGEPPVGGLRGDRGRARWRPTPSTEPWSDSASSPRASSTSSSPAGVAEGPTVHAAAVRPRAASSRRTWPKVSQPEQGTVRAGRRQNHPRGHARPNERGWRRLGCCRTR